MTAEEYIDKAAETNEIISTLLRELAGAKVPEFSSEEMTVADAATWLGTWTIVSAYDEGEVVKWQKNI